MTALDEIIRAEIRASGPISFERFMELALYYPELGYYAKFGDPSPIGRSGDFYTSVSVGPLFGRLLARQFFQMWKIMGNPDPFWIVEQGAHDGQLACDILEWCRSETPAFFDALRYAIIDASGPASIQQKCAPEAGLLSHMSWFETIEALAKERPVGVFVSNELIDAFPVRVIVHRSGQWLECHVTVDEKDALAWLQMPIVDPELQAAVDALDLPSIEDYTTEINLRARPWMAGVAAALERGYVVTIDYGYPASIYYEPYRRGGTLTAFVKHKASEDVLTEPGFRDLTAHVDFTALARVGEEAGLTTLGFLDQQRFLMGVAHDELSGVEGPRAGLAENIRAWNSLIHPDFLGSRFQVLVQAKNAPGELDGLRFARPGGLF